MHQVRYTGRAGARILTINGLDVVFTPDATVEMGDHEAQKVLELAPGEFRITPVDQLVDAPEAKPRTKPARATGKAST